MKATELRIGNFICTVAPCGVVDVKIVDADILYIAATRCNNYEPIPLTEEWLLKFGFIRCEMEKSTIVEYCIFDDLGVEYFKICCINILDGLVGYGIKKRITDIHQLQNLYYAMTGEELTLK
jgi:hypothetical protein